MSVVFLKILNMSISASWIVLVVLFLRLILKKSPKWIIVLLWGLVALRLICPFSFESVLSLVPSVETISPQVMTDVPQVNTGFPILNNSINPIIEESSVSVAPEKSINILKLFVLVFSKVWFLGIVIILLYTMAGYLKIKHKNVTAVLLRDNIYLSDCAVSPFVLGIFKPKIYVPFNLTEQDMFHVIAHENAHIKRRDYLWKPLGFILLCVHWFNPLMWVAYSFLSRDIELACDESVIKDYDNSQKADYSEALLTCSLKNRNIAPCPLAFGEVSVKNRVKSVLSYKKPAIWAIVIAALAAAIVAICFLTNPASDRVGKIDYYNIKLASNETVVWSSNGETHEHLGAVDNSVLQELLDIKISRREISLSRAEDRDKSCTIILQTKKDAKPSLHSYLEGLYIHFNSDFTSVWAYDGVKPTFSYKVLNPEKAKAIYQKIINYDGEEKITWTYAPMHSFVMSSAQGFDFDFDYTHIEAKCTEGRLWDLDSEKQLLDTKMRFENGSMVYWTPDEAVIEKIADKSEVTFIIYNNNIRLYECAVVFECISRDIASADFEIYLKKSDGLSLDTNGNQIILAISDSSGILQS